MSKNSSSRRSLANPSDLSPATKKGKETIRVVIETPKGSHNKYAFNAEEKVFELKKVLPSGMTFPYDFGFVPSTLADDGDPVDVLVLMDEPAFTGCVLKARIVGIIEGEQIGDDGTERNDRIIAVEQQSHDFATVKDLSDLGKKFVKELESFFVNYHQISGEKYRIIGVKGIGRALKLVDAGRRASRRKS